MSIFNLLQNQALNIILRVLFCLIKKERKKSRLLSFFPIGTGRKIDWLTRKRPKLAALKQGPLLSYRSNHFPGKMIKAVQEFGRT